MLTIDNRPIRSTRPSPSLTREALTDRIRLSSPPAADRLPRVLTDPELSGLRRAADVLIPASGTNPAASRAPGYERHLEQALVARLDSFELIAAEGSRLAA